MIDKEFKKLKHNCKGYEITHIGGELTKGYKPDIVLSINNQNYMILESEHGTSRKHFIGGMIKAAKFLTKEKKGILVFIILIKDNTKEINIAKQLKPYLNWIKKLTNLRDVYIIADTKYCKHKVPIELLSKEFLKFALKASS